MAKTPLSVTAVGHGDHGDHGHHIHPKSMYLKTAGILAFLMALTIFAAQFKFPFAISLFWMNIIAVGIAAVKTYFVVMNFMHVRWSSPLAKLWAFIGFFFVFALALIYADYFFRHHEITPSWQGGRPESALPRQIGSTDGAPIPKEEVNLQNRLSKGGMQ